MQLCIGGKCYFAHRLAWLIVTGEWPEHQLDHRNRIKSDNRWTNLRPATHAQNMRNVIRERAPASGVVGVRLRTDIKVNKWQARVADVVVGYFPTKKQAVAARRKAASAAFGEFHP